MPFLQMQLMVAEADAERVKQLLEERLGNTQNAWIYPLDQAVAVEMTA